MEVNIHMGMHCIWLTMERMRKLKQLSLLPSRSSILSRTQTTQIESNKKKNKNKTGTRESATASGAQSETERDLKKKNRVSVGGEIIRGYPKSSFSTCRDFQNCFHVESRFLRMKKLRSYSANLDRIKSNVGPLRSISTLSADGGPTPTWGDGHFRPVGYKKKRISVSRTWWVLQIVLVPNKGTWVPHKSGSIEIWPSIRAKRKRGREMEKNMNNHEGPRLTEGPNWPLTPSPQSGKLQPACFNDFYLFIDHWHLNNKEVNEISLNCFADLSKWSHNLKSNTLQLLQIAV